MAKNTVFISYAREDARHAERLYMSLREASIDAWLDTRCLLPGQNWRREIRRAINESKYFIALISQHSISKRGFVQAEIKHALAVLNEIPSHQIFLIPVCLDTTRPSDEELQNLNWVALYPNYESGLSRVLSALSDLDKKPLEFRDSSTPGRSPIEYTPYRRFADYARDFVERLPRSASVADRDYAIFVEYATDAPGVVLPDVLLAKYPQTIKIVIQNQFEQLTAEAERFTVVLWFDGKPQTLAVPYAAIREITLPAVGLRLENCGLTSAATST